MCIVANGGPRHDRSAIVRRQTGTGRARTASSRSAVRPGADRFSYPFRAIRNPWAVHGQFTVLGI